MSSLPALLARLLLVVSLLLVATIASAQETKSPAARADELTLEAEARYLDGEYEEAIILLEKAYDIAGNPNTLFNLGLVHETIGNLERALQYYEKFTDSAAVAPMNRKDAALRSKAIERILSHDADAPFPPVAGARPARANAPVPPRLSGDEDTAARRVEPARPTNRWRTIGIVTSLVGVATLGGGGFVGLLAIGAEDRFETATDLDAARRFAGRAQSLASVADGLFLAGGVLTLSGIVIAIASQPERSTPRVAIALSRGAARLVLSTRF